jgi:predicted RNase H-like nuclease (RuvC/YqgF family)
LQGRKPRLIVGVDPGTTLGLAALDLNGELLLLTSGKNLSKKDVLNILFGTGVPVLVASDRVIVPHFVSELAASLGATIFLPSQEATIQEKNRLVEEASGRFETYAVDEHQTAALYAALKAYAHYRNLFQEAEETVRAELHKKLPQTIEEVKALVLRDVPPSRAVRALLLGKGFGPSDQRALRALRKEADSAKERASSLRAELSAARAEIRRLRAMSPKAEERPHLPSLELQETQEKLRRALHEVEELRRRSEPYGLEGGGWIRLCLLGPLTVDAIASAVSDRFLSAGMVAYSTRVVGDADRCGRALASAGVHTLVLEVEETAIRKGFLRNEIAVLGAHGLPLAWRHGAPWIKRAELEKALRGSQGELDQVDRERIRNIIETYREERLQGQ